MSSNQTNRWGLRNELVDDLKARRDELVQDEDRTVFRDRMLSLGERYLRGLDQLHLHIGLSRTGGETTAEHFCVVLQAQEDGHASCRKPQTRKAPSKMTRAKPENLDSPVFVLIPEAFKDREPVPFRVLREQVIRLERLDDVLNCGVTAADFVQAAPWGGSAIFLEVFESTFPSRSLLKQEDWKARLIEGMVRVVNGQPLNQVVERRSHIVDQLPGDHSPIEVGGSDFKAQAQDILSRLWVRLIDDAIWLGFEDESLEGGELFFEKVEMLPRSIELGSTTQERDGHGA